MKKKEEPSSSNDRKYTMEAFVRRFDNFFQQDNEQWEHFEARMVEIERKQGIFNSIRQEKCALTFAENFLQWKREFNCEIGRLKEIVKKEN